MNKYTFVIGGILARLKADEYASYDHYDFWGSKTGIALRKNKSPLTMPLIGAAYFLDVVFPMFSRRNVVPVVSLETLPYILRAMLLYEDLAGKGEYERDRQKLLEHILSKMGQSEHGTGVGHQFDWYTSGLIPAYTPCATFTSYLVDYILEAGRIGDIPENLKGVLLGIGEFVYNDLNMVALSDGTAKVSYTPLDRRYVVNANSYAARMLRRLGAFFIKDEWTALSKKLVAWVIGNQNEDGSWHYFEKGSVPDAENFIDCFHSAFVLENLMEWAGDEGGEDARIALAKGKDYFLTAFIKQDGGVNHFSKSHLPIKIELDIRSMAQSVNCLALLSDIYPELLETARKVYKKTMETMYDGNGGFYFRKYSFCFSRMNYIRWGAAPMLNALCTLALAERGRKKAA